MIGRVVLLMLVLVQMNTLEVSSWQASGPGGWFGADDSDDEPNLPRLYTAIEQAGAPLVSYNGQQLKAASKTLSDTLNNLWDQAWNVAVGTSLGDDMIIYAYAFRNHWFWANGITPNLNLAVWKDYNCGAWVNTFKGESGAHPNSAKQSQIVGWVNSALSPFLGSPPQSLWDLGVAIVEGGENSFSTDNGGDKITLSVVFGEYMTNFAVNVCAFDAETWAVGTTTVPHTNSATSYDFILFQTREGNYRP